MRLVAEHRQGVRNVPLKIDDPSWSDVDAAIRALDQRTSSEVMLEAEEPAYLVVSGGAGKYIVLATTPDLENFALKNPTAGSGEEQVVAGGQRGSYPRRMVVPLELALAAARSYLAGEYLDPALLWEQDK